ncbi:MAG: SprT family zinc-dependent metalloprotease [Prosthecobacter sp.]|nr:SprT family zinc-dependent metalloprotease [Prosthecobacter sp.]
MTSPIEIETSAGLATLKHSNRKTLALSVLPDGSLELVAPRTVSLSAILAKVEKRRNWINAQRRAFNEMNAFRPVHRYVNGATHRYLGRQYRLKITKGMPATVTLRGAYLHVRTLEPSETAIGQALQVWYRRHAQEQFGKRVSAWTEWCKNRRLPKPHFRLRSMHKRWGSAAPDGTIYLNPELIRAPSACVDYVIAHEICHLKHPDHGRQFWGLLQQLVPNWKLLKARLERGEG